jgi:transcriptional regulator with XRE-family HTH domain
VIVTGPSQSSRARYALPPAGELERLGALVRSLRLEAGLPVRGLARRACVHRTTVQRLERGTLRPRPSLLLMIANAIDPDRCGEILRALTAAAASSMAAESPGWQRRRNRQLHRGWMTGQVPLPAAIGRPIALHQQAAEAWRAGMAALDQADAAADPQAEADLLDEADRFLSQARALTEEAGPPVMLIAGGHRVAYGFGYGAL